MTPHIVVVGGSRGLGNAFAAIALEQGFAVSILGRSTAMVPPRDYYVCDITRPDALLETLGTIRHERGELHGITFFQRFRGVGDDWEGEIRTSLTATRAIIEQSVPFFASGNSNSIVLVSSVNASFISPALPCSYHVAKAGMCQMARYYASKLGGKGIRVNAICPGTFIKPEAEAYYAANPAVTDRLARASPLNRIGSYAEVANVIFFLLSDKSSFITGQALVVDGGASLRWQESLDL